MPVDYVKLGARVKGRREKARMSQAELASATELSTQHISNIENAKTKVSLEKVVDIANVLNCSVDELLCDSVVKAKVIYINEVAGLIESFSDVEMRALTEFCAATVILVNYWKIQYNITMYDSRWVECLMAIFYK